MSKSVGWIVGVVALAIILALVDEPLLVWLVLMVAKIVGFLIVVLVLIGLFGWLDSETTKAKPGAPTDSAPR